MDQTLERKGKGKTESLIGGPQSRRLRCPTAEQLQTRHCTFERLEGRTFDVSPLKK